jgi:hypothetical protein
MPGMRAQASVATATGDTVKTIIDTITIPQSMKSIIGAWCYAVAGAGLTTLENMTGIFELESDDIALVPLQLPLDCVTIVTSGSVAFQPRIFPLNIPINGAEKIRGYVTMDMAITIASKARFGLIYSW